ncbi:MAG: DNA ligase [Deltaproteobacteria bacterium]|nr:DNA ligase [Deltaproteobacteria bacterium]
MPDLEDGESIEVKGSAARPYVIKNVGGVYSCSCPAWRNQSLPIEQRTCKHIRKLRGDEAEKERLGGALLRPKREAGEKSEKAGPPLLLAERWDSASDPSDWWMSEKLDGVRAYWDGTRFLSRQGNLYHAPDWFVAGLPGLPLDGELWLGRKQFQRTVGIVRRQDRSDHWKEIRFLVFDAPARDEAFEERLGFLSELLAGDETPYAASHAQQRCTGLSHLREELERIESLGGEGLMLREPGSRYAVGRSSTLLKVKRFQDAEALVLDHHAGKGKLAGKLGALVVRLEDGTQFSVGTGFTDAEREAPPPVGSIITFRYQELSDAGVPRFPSFVRVQKPGQGAAFTPAPEKTPAATAAASQDARRFELHDARSHKYWEIGVAGSEVTVRFGRIGSQGQTRVKRFDGAGQAAAYADKQIASKTGKGYRETPSPKE